MSQKDVFPEQTIALGDGVQNGLVSQFGDVAQSAGKIIEARYRRSA
jgi:alkylated DNA nucleotide flippase Atl1